MISAPTFDLSGKSGEKIALPKEFFEISVSPVVLARAIRVYLTNQRKAVSKTKTRGEVSKTTAKMFKQKGTGRARHGSYAAPIFVGGGTSHGPDGSQNFRLKFPKKLVKLALTGALSIKANQESVGILVDSNKAKGTTKEMVWIKPRTLVVLKNDQDNVRRAVRNLKDVTVVTQGNLNTHMVLANKYLLVTQEVLKEIC